MGSRTGDGGITYEVGENRIGSGFYVKALPRYSEPMEPVYGFEMREAAEAWIEADRAKHRPGRRPKALERKEAGRD